MSVFDGSATGRVPSEGSLSYHEQLRAGAWNLQEYGHYEIGDLPPGRYNVTGGCYIYDQEAKVFIPVKEQSKIVSLGEGETAEVNFDFR